MTRGPQKPWGKKAEEFLSDGKVHKFEDVVAQAGPMVPPGQAFRAGTKRTDVVDRDAVIYAGRRRILFSHLRAMEKSGQVVLWRDGEVWYVKRGSLKDDQIAAKDAQLAEIKKRFGKILIELDAIGRIIGGE